MIEGVCLIRHSSFRTHLYFTHLSLTKTNTNRHPLIDLIHCYLIYNIMGVGTGAKKDEDMSFVGLTYGELHRFWRVFGETYFGSAQKAKAMDALLEPYGYMMYYTSAMANPILPAQYHPVYVKSVREKVLSRYDELLGSLDGVWEA